MVKVIVDFLGKDRKPFLIVDLDPKKQSLKEFGARGAAIRGYLNFASNAEYFIGLGDQGKFSFQETKFQDALQIHACEPVVVFGFTYVFYVSFIQKMLENNGFKVMRYARKGFVQGYLPFVGRFFRPDGLILNTFAKYLGWYHCFVCQVSPDK